MVSFFTCQNEDIFTDVEQEQEVLVKHLYQQRMVSLSEIPKIKGFLTSKISTSIFSTAVETTVNEAIFDEENILEVIDTLNYANYSFRFKFNDTPIGEFYNLIVGKTPTGEFKTPFVLKYKSEENQLENYIANGLDFSNFKGKVSLHRYTDFFQEGYFNSTDGGTTNCPSELDEFGDPIPCDTQILDIENLYSADGSGPANPDGEDSGDSGSDGNSSGSDGNSGTGGGSLPCSWSVGLEDPCPSGGTSAHAPSECGPTGNGPGVGYIITIICLPINSINSSSQNTDCPPCNIDSTGGIGVNLTDLFTTARDEILECLNGDNNNLSTEARAFVNNENNIVELNNIHTYLNANKINDPDNPEQCYTPEAIAYVTRILEAGGNGILVSASPFVKYPENSNYESLYPKLTAILKNDLPKIANNQKVIDAINSITDAPIETIKEALKWGKGPIIQIQQLGGEGDAEKYGAYRGHLSDEFLNTLFLDIDLVNDFENSNITEISDALAFLIAVTILHEYVHLGDMVFGNNFWGDLISNEDYDPENEAGIIFEMDVFGEAVWRENAGIILRKIGGF